MCLLKASGPATQACSVEAWSRRKVLCSSGPAALSVCRCLPEPGYPKHGPACLPIIFQTSSFLTARLGVYRQKGHQKTSKGKLRTRSGSLAPLASHWSCPFLPQPATIGCLKISSMSSLVLDTLPHWNWGTASPWPKISNQKAPKPCNKKTRLDEHPRACAARRLPRKPGQVEECSTNPSWTRNVQSKHLLTSNSEVKGQAVKVVVLLFWLKPSTFWLHAYWSRIQRIAMSVVLDAHWWMPMSGYSGLISSPIGFPKIFYIQYMFSIFSDCMAARYWCHLTATPGQLTGPEIGHKENRWSKSKKPKAKSTPDISKTNFLWSGYGLPGFIMNGPSTSRFSAEELRRFIPAASLSCEDVNRWSLMQNHHLNMQTTQVIQERSDSLLRCFAAFVNLAFLRLTSLGKWIGRFAARADLSRKKRPMNCKTCYWLKLNTIHESCLQLQTLRRDMYLISSENIEKHVFLLQS